MGILLRNESNRMNIFKSNKRITHDNFSVCLLNTKSFCHGLIGSFSISKYFNDKITTSFLNIAKKKKKKSRIRYKLLKLDSM